MPDIGPMFDCEPTNCYPVFVLQIPVWTGAHMGWQDLSQSGSLGSPIKALLSSGERK